jgi:hypothetical protein
MQRFILLLCLVSPLLWLPAQRLPIDFESSALSWTDFGGGEVTSIANPQSGGINTSDTVGQMVKNMDQPFGGSFLALASPIDFSTSQIFSMKVYAPRTGVRVLLKVENANDGGIFFEQEETVSVANAWEELTFDYSLIDTSQTYSKVVLIFDNGTVGDGSADFTFLFDDIELVGSGGPALSQVDLPLTFEDSTVNYFLDDFEGGGPSTLVPDPEDANNTVASTAKLVGAGTSAGVTTSTAAGLASPIPLTETETKMNVRVYSPDAGIAVRLKIEDARDPTRSVETEAMTTMANAWETLEFDFANEATGTAALDLSYTYDKASLFFNFGVSGSDAGDKTYLWDDLQFGESESVAIEQAEISGLVIFPNPAQQTLNWRAMTDIHSVSILTSLGQSVRELSGRRAQGQVDLSGLAPGLYLLQLRTEAGGQATRRFQKR